jgi:hypothetical protein
VRYRIDIPDAESGPAAIRRFVAAWIDCPAFQRIVESDGGILPSKERPLLERVRELHEFSGRWDFRSGAERLDMHAAELDLDTEQLLVDAAELGLATASAPSLGLYEHGLVLGATALATINRMQYLRDVQASGTVFGALAGLTALREINEAEFDLARSRPELAAIVEGAQTEFDVTVAAAAAYFGGTPEVTVTLDDNPHLSSATAQIGDILVLAAPSSNPARRANSRDNFNAYATRIADGDRVCVTVSSIYLPYQFITGVLALEWHRPLTIEAIGFPPEWMGGVLTAPKNYLQELRSALYGMRTVLEALPAT